MSLIHLVGRRTGIPKDRDEVNRREVSISIYLFIMNQQSES